MKTFFVSRVMAECAPLMIGGSERTVLQTKHNFCEHDEKSLMKNSSWTILNIWNNIHVFYLMVVILLREQIMSNPQRASNRNGSR